MNKKLDQSIIDQINSEENRSLSNRELADKLGIHNTTVMRYREKTKLEIKNVFTKDEEKKLNMIQQYSPKQLEEILYRLKLDNKKEIDDTIGEKWYLKFWLISDTHYGNKQCARDEIGEFMDKAKDDWVECFIHTWDLVDGDGVYTWQIYELDKIGFDAQLEDVIKSYPDLGLPTYLVQGNHDESFLKKTGGDIGKAISLIRKDIINLGFYDARIKLNGVDINGHHWWGSSSYAKSYKIQKLMETINPKDQPHIFASGHWHTALYMFYRKIHGFLSWAFLKENLLAKRFNLDNTIWWRVIEVEIDKNGGTRIGMKFIKL